MKTFKEITLDRGYEKKCSASDNQATYILTSAYAHDLYDTFVHEHERIPSSKWFRKHFNFKEIETKQS